MTASLTPARCVAVVADGGAEAETTNVCTVHLPRTLVQRLRGAVHAQRQASASARSNDDDDNSSRRHRNNSCSSVASTDTAMRALLRAHRYRALQLHTCGDVTADGADVTRAHMSLRSAWTAQGRCRPRAYARLQRAVQLAATAATATATASATVTAEQQSSCALPTHAPVAAAPCVSSPSEALVQRWRRYCVDGDVRLFAGDARARVRLCALLGIGGSGRVYRGEYTASDGATPLPVAVKVFVRLDKHTDNNSSSRNNSNDDADADATARAEAMYVRECLTDVAFYVLCNQLDAHGVCHACRAHDFVVSRTVPRGLSGDDVRLLTRSSNSSHDGDDEEEESSGVALAYLITDCMDGALGRFLGDGDEDYDPGYDTLVNTPLHAPELFQLLYAQLVMRALFDWRVLDLMLNDQLRGDNMGYRDVCVRSSGSSKDKDSESATHALDGLLVCYDNNNNNNDDDDDAGMHYLHFPATYTRTNATHVDTKGAHTTPSSSLSSSSSPQQQQQMLLRLLYFIDLGQGIQPAVRALTRRGLIGETVLESCIVDDGLRRYWPADELYCKHIPIVEDTDTSNDSDDASSLCARVVSWATQLRVRTRDDAARALHELFALYAPHYNVAKTVVEQQQQQHEHHRPACVLTWTRAARRALAAHYVYRDCGDAVADV